MQPSTPRSHGASVASARGGSPRGAPLAPPRIERLAVPRRNSAVPASRDPSQRAGNARRQEAEQMALLRELQVHWAA